MLAILNNNTGSPTDIEFTNQKTRATRTKGTEII